jgi:hypothetical protein
MRMPGDDDLTPRASRPAIVEFVSKALAVISTWNAIPRWNGESQWRISLPTATPDEREIHSRHASSFFAAVRNRLRARARRDITVPMGTFVRSAISR